MLSFEPFGEAALLFRSAESGEIEATCFRLAQNLPEFVTDVACTRHTGLATFDPSLADPEAAETAVREAAAEAPGTRRPPREMNIAVVLDGEDLAALLDDADAGLEDFAEELASKAFPVAHLGFAPGFVYLDGLSQRFRRPRRASPRTRVPAGSIAIGGPYLGIYGTASPGGWNLVGTTRQRLFDERQDPPMDLLPGDGIRFTVVSSHEESPPVVTDTAPSDPSARPALEVLEGSGTACIEDAGRRGSGIWAVPRSGAADPWAIRLANMLVGNAPEAPAIEIPLGRMVVRALATLHLAACGAGLEIHVDGLPVPAGHCFPVASGQIVTVSASPISTYGYLAVAGGLSVERAFGSASYDRLSGFGPPTLAPHQTLHALEPAAPPRDHLAAGADKRRTVRVVAGPHLDRFSEDERRHLVRAAFTVSSSSSRVGVRLEGASFAERENRTLAESEPLTLGSIQVPPGGEPIVMLADHPVTGGYPVIATVILADLDLVAQARPGTALGFTYVEAEQARSAYRDRLARESALLVGNRPFDELRSAGR